MNASILSALGEHAAAKREALQDAPPSIMTPSQRDLWASIIARVPHTHRPAALAHFGPLVSAAKDGHEVLDVIERAQAYANAFGDGARPDPADFADGDFDPAQVARRAQALQRDAMRIAGRFMSTAEAVRVVLRSR